MKIKVTKDLCEIKENEIWNVGDYNVHTVQVELSPEFNGLVNKVRYFVEDNSYDMLITDNVAQVPYEATIMEGTIKIGVYGYDADTDILVQSTSPVNKYITSGTYTGDPDNTQPLTPTDKEQMETAIQKNTNDITDLKANKQDKLISGVNIKTINNESILSSGNLTLVAEETDPIFTNSPAYSITDNDITYWNNKANVSDIPDVSNFITKDVDNLTYYTKSTDMQNAINNAVGNERTARENADNNLQNQIDAITVSSDVVDVVSTYQDLVDYDTQHIKANDIIKVMQDSTHDNAISYYRWVIVNHVGSWEYVGSEGPYYTKSETDTLLNAKQNTITTTNKLQSDLVDDTNQTNLFVTSTEKTTWNNKLDQSDLTDYVKNTDYASTSSAGVVKTTTDYSFMVNSSGVPYVTDLTYTQYGNKTNRTFISKGTLENVIIGKNLETANNKVTSISSSSTDVQYPSAKCVYDNDVIIKDDVNTKYDYLFSLTNLFGKITGTGTSVTLNDTSNTMLKLDLNASETSQGDNPTPENPQAVHTISGDNTITISNSNNTKSQEYPINLGDIELCKIGDYEDGIRQSTGKNLFDGSITPELYSYNSSGVKVSDTDLCINQELNNIDFSSIYVSFSSIVGSAYVRICEYNSSGTFIKRTLVNTNQSLTLDSNTKKIIFSVNASSAKYFTNLMINEGTTALPYEPYGKVWYKYGAVGKVVLDGSEDYDRYSSLDTANYNCFCLTRNDFFVDSTGAINTTISNYFLGQSFNDRSNNIANMWVNKFASQLYFKVPNTITTSSELKTWLNTHNTIVYYVLATPTYTLLNDTLQTQLNNLQYALAYDTQTNISQTNNDLPFIINAETFAKIGG